MNQETKIYQNLSTEKKNDKQKGGLTDLLSFNKLSSTDTTCNRSPWWRGR